jgi:membrane protease YdiL (CAAX protease family)
MKRSLAVLEVTIVMAFTWAAYKAMKLVEPGGFNCSPGLAMLIATAIMSVVHRREFPSYGIVSANWRSGVTLGAVLTVLMLLGGALELMLIPDNLASPLERSVHLSVLTAAIRVLLYLPAILVLVRLPWQRMAARVPVACTLSLLAALVVAAPAYAVYHGAPVPEATGHALALVVFTAIGEEAFFRGYVQSHLNGVLGRPWRILGASLGPGLVISSLLFGLIHVFNPTRPYDGHWQLSWSWGAVTALIAGPLYGYLRELTGSIWTATVIHGLSGEYRGLWQVFLARR